MAQRRKYVRFPSKGGAFAALFRAGSLPVAGKVTDISLGGIGFSYLSLAELDGQFNLHLFGSREEFFHLDRLKCRVIHNCSVPEKSWGELISWRCGIKFERLTKPTMAELRRFMTDFAAPDSKPP